ncbi:MAG TPA: hypothetical protein VE092_02440 [Herbaspirillum sp.]|uniref:hypothetical protein n=1 Tax=Herbaspirillum sp. TaxID=1890675 RepID=UPI002D4EA720|nr:hypothetical protein [Herbaspirillum sp.]HZG18848.1 hypothetical protein [Herbaspirillum sp.]
MTKKEVEKGFNLGLSAVGDVHCRRLTAGDMGAIQKKERAGADAPAIAKCMLELLAKKSVDGTSLEPQEIEAVTEEELDLFCLRLVDTNLMPDRLDSLPETTRQADESAPDFLLRSWKQYTKIPDHLVPDYFKSTHFSSLVSFFDQGTIRSMSETAQRAAKLGSAIEKIRSPSGREAVKPIELQPLVSPAVRTNQHLQEIVEHNASMRDLAAECAALIQSMNATATGMQMDFMANSIKAERQAFWATWFAIGGFAVSILALVVSTAFSYVTLMDARDGAKENERLVEALKGEIRRLTPASK